MRTYVISPAMSPSGAVDWAHGTWVGSLDVSDWDTADLELTYCDGYAKARLLVRSGQTPLGFVEVGVDGGRVSGDELHAAISALPRRSPSVRASSEPPISVVVCSRDRPEALRSVLTSLLGLKYPAYEVVVVDNASTTNDTVRVVEELSHPQVRVVSEARPGLSRARNTGILAATHDVVAFTDDDVVVDSRWLTGLMQGFCFADDVACVCGMVPSGEIRSYSQAYFDGRVSWARSCTPRVYRLADPPMAQPLFPFQVGQYGTGANFAIRRSAVLALGGFDEALGVGSPTRGGEDIDMFVRVLIAGHALVYQPSAVVWHRHRAELGALHTQIAGYGLGLGAWITKLLLDRRTAPMVLARARRGLAHARRMTRVVVDDVEEAQASGLRRTELVAAARGPLAYLVARLSGARHQPLLAPARNALGPTGRRSS